MENNKTQYVLVKLNGNYADEFDVNSFWVTTKEEYKEFIEKLSKYNFTDSDEIYFGSNECISFYSTESLINSLSDNEIDEEFAQNIIEYLGAEYGLISIPSLLEYIEYKFKDEDE